MLRDHRELNQSAIMSTNEILKSYKDFLDINTNFIMNTSKYTYTYLHFAQVIVLDSLRKTVRL